MNQHWQYWVSAVSDAWIDSIITRGDLCPSSQSNLGFSGEVSNTKYRSSDIRWINPSDNSDIRNMIEYYAKVANKNAFGFIVDDISDIQYTTYDATDNGHYDWHIDTFWANPTCYDRKISVVIQLSDENDYEGGDFLIDSQYPQPDAAAIRKKGSVIVFPSFIPHCVTPVTRGIRKSLVSWVQGPKFR